VVIALAGCAHGTYRPDVTPLAEGRYLIRSAPDDEQRSEELAAQHAYRQANELCPAGYEQVDRKTGTASTTERVAIFGRSSRPRSRSRCAVARAQPRHAVGAIVQRRRVRLGQLQLEFEQ